MRFEKTFINGWTDRFEVLDVRPVPHTEDWILVDSDPIDDAAFAAIGQDWCEWRIECFQTVATNWGATFIYALCDCTLIFRPNMPAIAFKL